MMTYEQAREIVREAFEPGWRDGTFCLDDRTIVEDDISYVFAVGPRELLIDGDVSYARFGGGVPAVMKANGALVIMPEVRMALAAGALRTRPNPHPTLRA
jgi:hypothetical protein